MEEEGARVIRLAHYEAEAVPSCPARPERDSDNSRLLGRLIIGIAHRDRDAFTEFYRMTSHRVFGLALRMLHNRAAAEEITQEVYLQTWSHAERYDQRLASPIGWLMMLTHRRAVDRLRADISIAGRETLYGRTRTERERDVVIESVEERDDRRAVQHCLGTLTELQRESIELAYYGGLTYPDVADRLGTPVATVKSRIRDGLKRLRTCLTGSDHT